MNRLQLVLAAITVSALAAFPGLAQTPAENMSFFITSTNPGSGANLGGLAGADAHCETLAAAVGAGGKTWRAYLSTTGPNGVNARDRIGTGPWYNFRGDVVAQSVDDLHFNNQNLSKEMSLSEKGAMINGVGDQPNQHDILTGSNPDGTASDQTCNNWTSGADGAAIVGHSDRVGRGGMGASWVTAHPSRGCSTENLAASGGGGYFYCFATD